MSGAALGAGRRGRRVIGRVLELAVGLTVLLVVAVVVLVLLAVESAWREVRARC